MDKFLNMLENHIGFCTEVHKKKENLAAESFPKHHLEKVQWQEREQRQEPLHAAQRFVGFEGWCEG